MAKQAPNPIRDPDDTVRTEARAMLRAARIAALGVIEPDTGAPFVSRIALSVDADGRPFTLISDIALHSRALRSDPRGCLLIGEPAAKGDPLTHPRLSISVKAQSVHVDDKKELRDIWLNLHPKSKLYADFADFRFLWLDPVSALFNAGFGKAYALDPNDLRVT